MGGSRVMHPTKGWGENPGIHAPSPHNHPWENPGVQASTPPAPTALPQLELNQASRLPAPTPSPHYPPRVGERTQEPGLPPHCTTLPSVKVSLLGLEKDAATLDFLRNLGQEAAGQPGTGE